MSMAQQLHMNELLKRFTDRRQKSHWVIIVRAAAANLALVDRLTSHSAPGMWEYTRGEEELKDVTERHSKTCSTLLQQAAQYIIQTRGLPGIE